jgi:hypothetical protein
MSGSRACFLVISGAMTALGLGACQVFFPTEAPPDAGADSPADAPPARDAKPAGDAGPFTTLTAQSNWSIYSVGVNPPAFQGGTYDGRYVYFSPSGYPVERYDTRGGFTAPGSWTAYDPTLVIDGGSNSFRGAAFDGRYVYVIPTSTGANVVFRYDSTAAFDSQSSWQGFGISAAFPTTGAFAGATFDGRYLYLVPTVNGVTARFDTHGTFGSPTSWSIFDLQTVNAQLVGLSGGLFDGRYVYYVPDINFAGSDGATVAAGVMVRYDTMAPFATGTSWSAFDVTSLNSEAGGFIGGAFDGRYIYLAPYSNVLGYVARFDTKTATSLSDKAAWSFFSANMVNSNADGFAGAAFDGRYVYFVPNTASVADGLVARFDTTGTFDDAAAWSTFDQTQLNANAIQFWGAVFDGQFLYFVPDSTGVVTRFEARDSPSMPKLPGFSGSFY